MDMQPLIGRDETIVIVGVFDLMGFAKWSENRRPKELLELATALFHRTGNAIKDADGRLTKAIGDAGLFVFSADEPDKAVLALMEMKRDCDTWLAERGYPDVMSVRVQVGPVACGSVGPTEDERLDVYGEVVNHAAMMRGRTFTISEGLVDQLTIDLQRNFVRLDGNEYVVKH